MATPKVMALDPQLMALFVATSGVGYLMIMSGVQKSLLDWKRRRTCPACGRRPCSCV
jgi:hypothetical protein